MIAVLHRSAISMGLEINFRSVNVFKREKRLWFTNTRYTQTSPCMQSKERKKMMHKIISHTIEYRKVRAMNVRIEPAFIPTSAQFSHLKFMIRRGISERNSDVSSFFWDSVFGLYSLFLPHRHKGAKYGHTTNSLIHIQNKNIFSMIKYFLYGKQNKR